MLPSTWSLADPVGRSGSGCVAEAEKNKLADMEAEALATAFQRSLEDASVRAQGWDCEVCTFVNAADRKGSLRHCGIAFSSLHSPPYPSLG